MNSKEASMETLHPFLNVSVHLGLTRKLSGAKGNTLIHSTSENPVKPTYFLPLSVTLSQQILGLTSLFSWHQFYPFVAVDNCCNCCSRIIILKDSLVL